LIIYRNHHDAPHLLPDVRNLGENMRAGAPNQCLIPTPLPPNESEIYSHIRDLLIKTHCDAKRGHQCCGRITIDREHITFNCPLCGDARNIITVEPKPA